MDIDQKMQVLITGGDSISASQFIWGLRATQLISANPNDIDVNVSYLSYGLWQC
jgi:hypothetical protein